MTLQAMILDRARTWINSGDRVVMATISHIRGSSSQPLTSRMAINAGGAFVGFVSGGCVEADVAEHASALFAGDPASGAPGAAPEIPGPARLLHYRQVQDGSIEIGLNCEGSIEVLLEPATSELVDTLSADKPTIVVTSYVPGEVVEVDRRVLAPGGAPDGVDPDVVSALQEVTGDGVPRSVRGSDGRTTLVELVGSPPTLLIVSASSVAYPLSSLAKTLGYRVVISDPRSDYVTRDLFPDADELLCIWPRELPKHVSFGPRVYVVSLNHEARFEDDLFTMLAAGAAATGKPVVGYLGAIGKAKRQTERVERLTAAGVDLSILPPIHTPIGLDLGGKGAEEVALSVMAEIQAHRYGRTGGRLKDTRSVHVATADLDTPSADRS